MTLDYSTFHIEEKESLEKSPMYITHLIGQGKFLVYHAHSANNKAEYAVKLFPQNGESLALFSKELRSLAMLNHPNIIKYISHNKIRIEGAECNMLIIEYAPYGDFFDLVMSHKMQGDERFVRHFFHQLINGLEYLHSQHHIAHCDLKLENLLLGKDGRLKITDFDQAHSQSDDTSAPFGTKGYRAPEVICGTCQNVFAADIFSAGVVLYILITGQMPFFECGDKKGRRLEGYDEFCGANDIFWNQKAEMYPQNGALRNKEFRELINGMFQRQPGNRLSIEKIKQSKWYKGQIYDEEQLGAVLKRLFRRADKIN